MSIRDGERGQFDSDELRVERALQAHPGQAPVGLPGEALQSMSSQHAGDPRGGAATADITKPCISGPLVRSQACTFDHFGLQSNVESRIAVDPCGDGAFAWPGDGMRQPTLFLTVGLPAAGKTRAARRMEIEHDALRLTKGEWVKALYGHENPSSASDVIEGRLIEIGLRALELGSNVVIDYGLWGRNERSALRQAAADLGACVEMHYFEVAPVGQRRRLDQRQAEEPDTTWPMSDEELAEWAGMIQIPTRGELDVSEPIDDPPAGFASWDEWRGHRWPPAIS